MKRAYFILFIISFFTFHAVAQITITGNTTLCAGESTTLTASTSGTSYGTTNYIFETIDFNNHPLFFGGTVVDPDFTGCTSSLHDDCFAPANGPSAPYGYPIGFTFCFFNQQYDHFWVGSNGWVGFSNPTTQSWTTYVAAPIPNTATDVPKNCIFSPWQDWFPGANGAGNDVYYYTTGTAPDRKLVVYWTHCPLFDCQTQTSNRGTFMIVLNEQSSIIENFIQLKPQCTGSGASEGATQGVINLVGDVAYTATGRNYQVWTAANEGTRFTPSGITWYKDAYPGGTQVGYGTSLFVTPAVTTTYFAVVGNCDGTVASNSVVVTVNPRPAPTLTGGGPVACQNDVKTYTTESTGVIYNWLYSGTQVLGGGTADHSVTLKWSTTGPNFVSVNYSNAFGCMALAPTTLAVTVNPFETPVLTTVTDQFCAEEPVTFTTQAGKTNYIWDYLTSGATWISGGSSTDHTVTVKWSTPGVKTVTVNYTDAGCTGDPPTAKQVTIKPLPVINGPLAKTICSGNNTSISLSSSPPGANFSWNSPAPSCSANILSCPAGLASGSTINDVLTLTDQNPGSVTYHIKPVLNGCTGGTQDYPVDINPVPTVVPGTNQVLCNGEQTSLIQFTGDVPGTIYNWSNDNTSIGLAAGGAGDISPFTAINLSNVPVTASITVTPVFTNAGVTCTGTPSVLTITVNPTPALNPVAGQVLCDQAGTSSVTFSGNVPGTVYNWLNSNTSIGLAAGGTGNISSFTAQNATNAPVTATITATPSFTGGGITCAGMPGSFDITVNPVPTVNGVSSQVLCHSAVTAAVNFTGFVPGTIYNWVNSNATIGLAASGSGDISPFTVTNITNAPVTASITVTPAFTNVGLTCSGVPATFTITVNPIPTVNIQASQVLCHSANTAPVNFTGNVPGTVYSWVNTNTSIGLAASGTGDIAAFTAL
ncbi:MAG: PKD-like domain-containing protein, partial [Bacteroidota bacterium]